MTIKANTGRDIVVTWPKDRPLESYLDELKKAEREGLVINYRVSSLPRQQPDRCYMVHSGFVRGYNRVIDMGNRDNVVNPVTGERMTGLFIVREPVWFPIAVRQMRGFQGWRYIDREELHASL